MSTPPNHRVMDLVFSDLIMGRNSTALLGSSDKATNAELELKKWLFEKRLDYAWHFFDHHAKQRMQMFNFFLVFVGFVLAAYATTSKEGYGQISTAISLAGAGLTILFIFLERRNEELVHISEDVLESLESDVLFPQYRRPISWPRRRSLFLGKMERLEGVERQLGIFLRQKTDEKETWNGKDLGPSPYEHGRWIPWFQRFILGMFLVLAVMPWVHGTMNSCLHLFGLGFGVCK